MTKVLTTERNIIHNLTRVKVEIPHSPEPTILTYGKKPTRVPILVPDDDDFCLKILQNRRKWYTFNLAKPQVTITTGNRYNT